jgi:hypothetical protein
MRIGKIKINILNTTQRFSVHLASFIGPVARMELVNATKISSMLAATSDTSESFSSKRNGELSDLEENIEKRLQQRHITKNCIELTQTINARRCIYRRVLKLNMPSECRCVLIPVLYSLKYSTEIHPLNNNNTGSQNHIGFNLGDNAENQMKIIFNNSVKLNQAESWSNGCFNWIEIKSNECLNLEVSLLSDHVSLIDDVCICLFWMEYEICSYMHRVAMANMHKLQSHISGGASSVSNVIDALFSRFIGAKFLFSGQAGDSMNESGMKRLSMASLSSLDSYSSDQSSMQSSKSSVKATSDDLARAFRQAMKCSMVKMTLDVMPASNSSSAPSFYSQSNTNRFMDEDSLELGASSSMTLSSSVNNQSSGIKNKEHSIDTLVRNKTSTSHLTSLSTNSTSSLNSYRALNESYWSVSPSCVSIENIKSERLIESYTAHVSVRNNLSHKPLDFTLVYDHDCLRVTPSGTIHVNPLDRCEITIKPTRRVFPNLPWIGLISIVCNQSQKDVQVSLFSNVSAIAASQLVRSRLNQ